MEWITLIAVALAFIVPGHEAGRCPAPRVSDLDVRPLSSDGMRVIVRGRAHVGRGRINAIEMSWGDGHALIADLVGRRQVPLTFIHRYRRPGTYRISVFAESDSPACRRFKRSPPAPVRIRVPLAPH